MTGLEGLSMATLNWLYQHGDQDIRNAVTQVQSAMQLNQRESN